ncbi:hypothetical protein [Nocardioides sp. SLBN-35]|uniref:hypothetical protein n=1 Tax=Nocardioides sp. SLBN-35 TaxID=2768445 RepID=UPI001153EBB6|nr:hypothetical protein [Nocardioides sp. SLBN-35]
MNAEGPRERSGDPGRWPRYQRPGTDDVERESRDAAGRPLPEASAPAGRAPTSRSSRRRRRGRRRLGSAVVVLAVFGVVRAVAGGGEQAPEPLPAEDAYEPIATEQGFDALGDALTEKTGSTQILELRGYGTDDMQVTVPPEQEGDLAEVWRWDGQTLEKWLGEKAGDKLPFDLDDVDPNVLVDVDEDARSRSEGRISDSRYDVEKPVDADYDHWIYLKVYEVDHGGVTLWADLEGNVESDLVNKNWRDD